MSSIIPDVEPNRYLFKLSYNGSQFKGSQKQPAAKTIFGLLEFALFRLFKQSIICIPCGRTDTGVHAMNSYCHCDFLFSFDPLKILKALNDYLVPQGIIIRDILLVSNDFHALSSASVRQYNYYFTFSSLIPNYLLDSVTYLSNSPFFIPEQKELQSLFIGTSNFSKFCNTSSDFKSSIRSIYSMDFNAYDYHSICGHQIQIYRFYISAQGFYIKWFVILLVRSCILC